MKRILCAVLALVMILGFAGCKQDTAETEPILASSEEFTEETMEETEEETEEVTEEETEETEETSEPTETTEETVPPCANHSWGYWVQLEAPTSSAEGKRVRTCTVCGTEDVQMIEKLPKPSSHKHKYKTETSKSTCEEDGWVYYYCSCGDWYQVEEKATDHDWTDWTVKTRAQKGKDGTVTDSVWTRSCKKCKETETKKVPYCKDDKHEFGAEKKLAPTCKNEGYSYKECKVCGYRDKYNQKPATGKHTWGKWTVISQPTYNQEGKRKHTCTVCNQTVTESFSVEKHDCQAHLVNFEEKATCTEKGRSGKRCSICKQEFDVQVLPALEHDYKVTGGKEPTCTEKGYTEETCSRCQDVRRTELDKTAHQWQEKEGDPSKQVCSVCGEERETPSEDQEDQ